ncbi:MAG: hypothetical protein M3O67_03540 [Bacteroidota bacterium]|nr:hypothetical protein [Bacteroidota bacterium]
MLVSPYYKSSMLEYPFKENKVNTYLIETIGTCNIFKDWAIVHPDKKDSMPLSLP